MSVQPESQFDFWLGQWDAHWGEDGKATNTVTSILDDKIVQEDFVAPDLHGMSFSLTLSASSVPDLGGWQWHLP
jgi:hypothetical protein